MYRVLVADDEPIILSGIRHMIDWEKEEAEIVGVARNGAEAYSIIEKEHPDIVITDIRMPLMDGISLVGKCSTAYPDIVFIILTSLAEFSLAREAVGFGVTDYLLKTELDSNMLLEALGKAKKECSRRSGVSVSSRKEDDAFSAVSSLFLLRDIPAETKNILYRDGLLSSYALIAFVYQFPAESFEKEWETSDYEKLHDWEEDIISKILKSMLGSVYPMTALSGKECTLLYFVPGVKKETWAAVVSRISDKVHAASEMVTGLSVELLYTDVYTERENLKEARNNLELRLMGYYLDKKYDDVFPASLDIDSVFPNLELSISSKDSIGCKVSFQRIHNAVDTIDHSLNQLEFTVTALRSAISGGLSNLGLSFSPELEYVFSLSGFISKRREAAALIEDVSSSLISIIENAGGSAGSIVDKAREYVLLHIAEKISLSDVADYACVSPGYMSKSFNRVMGMSLVDYINKKKVEKAKEMMETPDAGGIADIAIALGFSNIYYFSKVFRRVEGIPPTEYMKKITGTR